MRDIAGEIQAAVAGLGDKRRPILVALDGQCGAGKTTLAGQLGQIPGWGVVHMDDFFLRPKQRTPQRLADPGGNVDWERVLAEVLLPLQAGRAARYRPYDCQRQELKAPVTVQPERVVLVEGAYSCHPRLWGYYDLRIFLSVGREEQMMRILSRSGPQRAMLFQRRWIPMEERYFEAFDIPARCQMWFWTGAEGDKELRGGALEIQNIQNMERGG